MPDEFPMGNQSLTDIINLKQLENLLNTLIAFLFANALQSLSINLFNVIQSERTSPASIFIEWHLMPLSQGDIPVI